MKKVVCVIVVSALVALSPGTSQAYPVGPALEFGKIVEEADVIVKAIAVSSNPIEDEWFKNYQGYVTFGTEMAVVSVIKGGPLAGKIVFHHYGYDPDYKGGYAFAPQLYDFKPGRPYIVFAKKTDRQGVLRQLWNNHNNKADQGAFLAADKKAVDTNQPVKQIVWNELNKLLKSAASDDVVYAIRQLDEMSNLHSWHNLQDFDREKVLEVIAPLLASADEKIATRAIQAVAQASPYRSDNETVFWLASVGKGTFHGIGKRDASVKNTEGRRYWKELAAVADGDAPLSVRALAIRALGRTGESGVFEAACRWTGDPDPLIRKSAAILLADFPGPKTLQILEGLSRDKAFGVRVGVARAIGFGQFAELLPVLEGLLKDDVADVRTAAALSLKSFGPVEAGEILKANRNHPDFRSVYVNTLAEKNPKPYLEDLAEIIEKRLEPPNFWGGRIPYVLSWDILFKYLGGQNADTVRSGKFDKYLDALEGAKFHGSSEPRDLYKFYVTRGMAERARKFRAKCNETVSFNMEIYFERVDKEYGRGSKR